LPIVLVAGCSSVPEGDPSLPWQTIGTSLEGRPIQAAEFGTGSEVTLIFAGFHGNEKIGVTVAHALCRELDIHPSFLRGRRVVIVPILNPDGYARGRRTNAAGIDLNRNFPTRDWRSHVLHGPSPASEPETCVVMDLVDRLRPVKIISVHDPMRMNNYDGTHSRSLAQWMAEFNAYPVSGTIGYPTPGSFGTWAGVERRIAMVTLEIPNGDPNLRWRENRGALLAAIRHPVDLSTRE